MFIHVDFNWGYPWGKKKMTHKDGVKTNVATKSVSVEDALADIGVDAGLEATRNIPNITKVDGDVAGEIVESMIATPKMETSSTPASIGVDLGVGPKKSVLSALETETSVP